MSHKLINHSPDLKKLRDEGYEVEVKAGYLLVHSVPYVTSSKGIARGTLVSKLDLAGDRTAKPGDHVAYFRGEHPCNKDGSIITAIQHSSPKTKFSEGVEIDHMFSNKPRDRMYEDYYEKVTTYIKIISSQAQSIDSSVTARTFKPIESNEPDSVFNYLDTNSSRANIYVITSKLENQKIGIIGLGGTGSYILDFVAKTPVKEIHLFDGDSFLQHNAFRSPGAASVEKLREQPRKVIYLHQIYSNMRKNIIPHDFHITSLNLNEIAGMDFVFICIDNGEAKKSIFDKLIENGTPFVDVGIGVEIIDDLIIGSARLTTITGKKSDHIDKRVSFSDKGNDEYSQNVQIAELNALNAALAVIKWKKIFNFYKDCDKEHNSVYDLYLNKILNDETLS